MDEINDITLQKIKTSSTVNRIQTKWNPKIQEDMELSLWNDLIKSPSAREEPVQYEFDFGDKSGK